MHSSELPMGANSGDDAFDHLVYLRIFEGCNLHCEHCFIPSNPKRMTLEQIATVPEQVAGFADPGQTILLQWHGGEPTALGAAHLEKALSLIEDSGAPFHWQHGIQTNLYEYNARLRDVFLRYFGGHIGVSWDPDIRLLRRNAPETNAQYEERFWRNFRQAREDGLHPYLIVTGTRVFFERFANPYDLFDFMEERRVEHLHIERLTPTGYARDAWSRIGLTNRENSDWMARLARAYASYCQRPRAGVQPLKISPFDGQFEAMDRLMAGEAGGYGCHSGNCDSRFHTIDANGYKRGCTALTSELDNPRHAHEQTVVIADPVAAREKRQRDCGSCEFRPICSSGCMAQPRVDASGECAGGFRFFQALQQLHGRY